MLDTLKSLTAKLSRVVIVAALTTVFVSVSFLSVSNQMAIAQNTTINQGLIGYWQFERDNVSDVIRDRSGEGNNGRLINSSIAELGRYGRGLDVTGSPSSFASIDIQPDASLNSLTDQLTVTAWIYPDRCADYFSVVASRQLGGALHPDQFYLGFGPDIDLSSPRCGEMSFKWHLSTDGEDCLNNAFLCDINTIPPGQPGTNANRWIHMAGTYDGNLMKLYVDGEEIGERSLTGAINLDPSRPLTVGVEENGGGHVPENPFDGRIDEIRIYNRALMASEIAEIASLEPPVPVSPGIETNCPIIRPSLSFLSCP
jgi:hypothetical protein